MTYTRGDTVVHPRHGTATVEGMVSKDVGNGPEDYLELYVDERGLKIMVPANSVEVVGIRDLSTKTEANVILSLLEEPSEVPEGWAERNVTTTARMKSNDLVELALVVRDLSRHKHRTGKPLTARERELLTSCLDVVARELSLALDLSEEDTQTLLVAKSLSKEGAST